MPSRTVTKCRRRGWWWWRSWRRSSSRHFRWKSRPWEERRPRARSRRSGGDRSRGRARLVRKKAIVPESHYYRPTTVANRLRKLLVSLRRLARTLCRLVVVIPRWISRRTRRGGRRGGWRWWRFRGSRHTRWKLSRLPSRISSRSPFLERNLGVASWQVVLRGVSLSFLRFASECRFRGWWLFWRRWRECEPTRRREALVPRKDRSTIRGANRRRGRRAAARIVLDTDVACSARSTLRKDPP